MIVHGERGLLAPGATVYIRQAAGGELLAAGTADAEGGFRVAIPDEGAGDAVLVSTCAAQGDGAREQTIVRIKLPSVFRGLVAVVEVARARHFDSHGSGRLRAQAAAAASAEATRLVAPRVRLVFADGTVAAVNAR